jgi:hypothetical protein
MPQLSPDDGSRKFFQLAVAEKLLNVTWTEAGSDEPEADVDGQDEA